MNLDRLLQALSAIHPVSESLKAAIEKELVSLSLPKDYLLLEAPKISRHVYFLDSGFAMSFTYVNGEKCVDNFWNAGQIIISARSFFEQVPSLEFIQLTEKSDVMYFSHDGVAAFPEASTIYRIVMTQYYEQAKEKFRDMHQLSAEQRHEKLLKQFPRVGQMVSQEYIASYLGITPQSLSRIKRRRSRS